MTINYNAIITREKDIFVAWCPELDIVSQGSSKEEARYNLKEALDLFIEAADPLEVQNRLKNNEAMIYPEQEEDLGLLKIVADRKNGNKNTETLTHEEVWK